MDFNSEIILLEKTRDSLAKDPHLTSIQASSLSAIQELVNETEADRKRKSDATRSRRKGSHSLLSAICNSRLGLEILFLCSITLPITKLWKINRNVSKFISQLETWKHDSTQIPQAIRDLAEQNFRACYEMLSQKRAYIVIANDTRTKRKADDQSSHSEKRLRGASATLGQGALLSYYDPSYHGIVGLKAVADKATSNDDSSSDHSGYDSEQDEVLETGMDVQATQSLNPEEVNLYARVYELKALDVIYTLVNAKDVTIRLTVPHLPDSTPFITVTCPRILAMRFLTKREPVKW